MTRVSSGSKPTRAVVVSREFGFQVLKVPAKDSILAERCVFHASLGSGEVHVASLGWRELVVIADAPSGENTARLVARARCIRIYQNASGTGIQTSWCWFRGWIAQFTVSNVTAVR